MKSCVHCKTERTYIEDNGVCNVCMGKPAVRHKYNVSSKASEFLSAKELDEVIELQRETMPQKDVLLKPIRGCESKTKPIKSVGRIELTTHIFLHPDTAPEAIAAAQRADILEFLRKKRNASPELISETLWLHLWVVKKRLYEIDPDTYPKPEYHPRTAPSAAAKRLKQSISTAS